MRILLLSTLASFTSITYGQLYIGPGAQLSLTGNAILSVNDMTIVNYGNFSAGSSTFHLTGGANQNIGGTQPLQFYHLQLNKSAGRNIVLQRPISVAGELRFTQGLINLNGFNLDLGTTGILVSESETNHVIGSNGGEVLTTANLNAPANVNPGNLGAIISSTQNLGSTQIRRGHVSQNNIQGGTILRYYHIIPTNNNNLNATLRINYLDSELNGLDENILTKWRSVDGNSWSHHGFTTRNTSINYVEKTGIEAFSLWTLASSSAALPVTFTQFNLQCDGGKVFIRWTTAQEFNSSHFIVEKGTGTGWQAIGQVAAAGNSGIEKNYEFIDQHAGDRSTYRIAQYDIDGRVTYTKILIADCGLSLDMVAWPNPFLQSFAVRINNQRNEAARLRVVDASGRIVVTRQIKLQNGTNQFELDMIHAAKGIYLLTVEWIETGELKTLRLIKR